VPAARPTCLLDAAKGLIYLALGASTLAVALQGGGGVQGGEAEQEWAAELLGHQFGHFLVEAVGVVRSASVLMFSTGVSPNRLRRTCGSTRCHPGLGAPYRCWARRAMSPEGDLRASSACSSSSPPLGSTPRNRWANGALKKLAGQSYGSAMLVLVALGLLCFGPFSFVEAQYRKVLQA
jgi:Domain of Unknown Function (DUF1206)